MLWSGPDGPQTQIEWNSSLFASQTPMFLKTYPQRHPTSEHVTFAHVIISNKDHRFIFSPQNGFASSVSTGFGSSVYEVNSQELVVKNPVRFAKLFNPFTHNFPGSLPFSHQPIQGAVTKGTILAVNFLWKPIRHVFSRLSKESTGSLGVPRPGSPTGLKSESRKFEHQAWPAKNLVRDLFQK